MSYRYSSFLYGVANNTPLEFTFIFGANLESIDENDHLDRWDIEAISSWLTGQTERKWLEIQQPDLETIRYKYLITDLKLLHSNWEPWAFSCKVSCDSPYAYLYPVTYEFSPNGSALSLNLFNRSTHNGYYSSNYVSIINQSDNNREFLLSELPVSQNLIITIDNVNQIIKGSSDISLYDYFNLNFFRLRRGDNLLKINGYCKIKMTCEFPVNIGG